MYREDNTVFLGNSNIILKYQCMIFTIARKYGNAKNFADLCQTGALALLRSVETYDPNKGAALGTYIYMNVRNDIQKEVNAELGVTCNRKTAFKYNLSTTTLEKLPLAKDNTTPLDNIIQEEDERKKIKKYRRLWVCLNGKLDNIEREIIIDYFINNYSHRKLQLKYGKNCQAIIKNAITIIKEDMRQSSSSSYDLHYSYKYRN